MTSSHAALWDLDPNVIHLNHGSFGATPRAVLERQREWRRRSEANPVRFYGRELFGHLDEARRRLAEFVGADDAGLAFVPNVSTGVNAVLRSLGLLPGDELLVTDHAYGAARNAVDYVAGIAGATVTVAHVAVPVSDPADIVAAVVDAVTPATRLAVIDHVTSPTGIVFPITDVAAALAARNVPVLVDGAHAPGMLDLGVAGIGAAYYTGNCHKWMCAPKGAAFLWTREDVRPAVAPVVIGWGRTSVPPGRSRYHAEFDWVGTDDPSAYLCVPAAIDVMGEIFPGGWAELQRHNHDLVLAGRSIVAAAIGAEPVVPDAVMGSMAIIPLPPAPEAADGFVPDPLQTWLADERHIEAPVTHGPKPDDRWLRISAQAYNSAADYERLADAVTGWLAQQGR